MPEMASNPEATTGDTLRLHAPWHADTKQVIRDIDPKLCPWAWPPPHCDDDAVRQGTGRGRLGLPR